MKNLLYYRNKYRKFKYPKILYIFEKILEFFIIFTNCSSEDKKYL